jgi:DNA polymerase V
MNFEKAARPLLALVDCDNFYVSCERVFQPRLRQRPVVVLSNNDGCIIARSREAKKTGLKMGTPYFKVEKKLKKNDVIIRSSNYSLYGDMARRMRILLENYSPRVETYSIDEYFISLPSASFRNLKNYAQKMRSEIKKQIGLPVSVGIGPTKTLTKIAMEIAKREDENPVQNTEDWEDIDLRLREVDIKDVWGIGSAYRKKCREAGINTAFDLKKAPGKWLRENLTVEGLRRKKEIQGLRCLPLEEKAPARKQVVCSRMFGQPSSNYSDLKEAVISYASSAARRLREQNIFAGSIEVFVRSKRYRATRKYANSCEMKFSNPVRSDHQIASKAACCLENIYRKNICYRKCGVILKNLVEDKNVQVNLLEENNCRGEKIAGLVDGINKTIGKGTLKLLGEGFKQNWAMKRRHLSNHYTTRWEQLPVAKSS